MVPRRTDSPSVREPSTNGNHDPIGISRDGHNANIQSIPVSMEHVLPQRTEYQSVTSTSGEYF